eukprot:Awhi_evm1s6435
MTLVTDFFIGLLRITYTIRLSITYPSTLNNLSTISDSISTSIYTSTKTLTYSSGVKTFIISTTTTTALSYNNSYSSIQIHDPTLFPTFTSIESKKNTIVSVEK